MRTTPGYLPAFRLAALLLLGFRYSYQGRAQSLWVTMPSAPGYIIGGQNNREVNYLKAGAPNTLSGTYYESDFRYGGFVAFQTTDNGLTWQIFTLASRSFPSNPPGPVGTRMVDYCMLNTSTAWGLVETATAGTAVTTLVLKGTTSGPTSFANISTALPADFVKIHFFSPTTGVAIAKPGNGSNSWGVYRTLDGGVSWNAVPARLPAVQTASGLETLVHKEGLGADLWVSTSSGNVLHTSDFGLTWNIAATGLGTNLGAVVFRDASNGLAYKMHSYDNPSTFNRLARTADGGATWTMLPTRWPSNAASITVLNGVYIGGGSIQPGFPYGPRTGVLATSTDDGASWQTRLTDDIFYSHLTADGGGQLWAATSWTSRNALTSPANNMLLRYGGTRLSARAEALQAGAGYPNPTTGLLHLTVEPGAVVSVYDSKGRQHPCPRTASQLDLAGLGNGLYLIKIIGASGATSLQRVMVAH